MTHCKDCRHWMVGKNMTADQAECEMARNPFDKKTERHPRSLMVAEIECGTDTGESMVATLFTAPDFGCVHGDPK